MAFGDGLKDKIIKLGGKGKIDSIVKYIGNPSEDVRVAVAMALGMIPTYDSGTALIPLFRDQAPMVRAAAAEAAADINAKHLTEYVKRLAFEDEDPNVQKTARRSFEKLKDKVV